MRSPAASAVPDFKSRAATIERRIAVCDAASHGWTDLPQEPKQRFGLAHAADQFSHLGRIGRQLVVAEIGLMFIEREMLFDDPSPGRDGQHGRFGPQSVVGIADRAAIPFGEERESIASSPVPAESDSCSRNATGPILLAMPRAAHWLRRNCTVASICATSLTPVETIDRFSRAGDLFDEWEKIVVARGDFVGVDQWLQKIGSFQRLSGVETKSSPNSCASLESDGKLPLGQFESRQSLETGRLAAADELSRPDRLEFHGTDAASSRLTDHLGGEFDVSLVVIADFGHNQHGPVGVERADLHGRPTAGLWK